MKIVQPGVEMRLPQDCVGLRFKCVNCRCVYEIESADEVQPGNGVARCNLYSACPSCMAINCVACGGTLLQAPVEDREDKATSEGAR